MADTFERVHPRGHHRAQVGSALGHRLGPRRRSQAGSPVGRATAAAARGRCRSGRAGRPARWCARGRSGCSRGTAATCTLSISSAPSSASAKNRAGDRRRARRAGPSGTPWPTSWKKPISWTASRSAATKASRRRRLVEVAEIEHRQVAGHRRPGYGALPSECRAARVPRPDGGSPHSGALDTRTGGRDGSDAPTGSGRDSSSASVCSSPRARRARWPGTPRRPRRRRSR